MLKRSLDKKGSLDDVLLIMLFLAIAGVLFIMGLAIWTNFDDTIQSSSLFPQESKDASTDVKSQFTGTIDGLFIVILGALVMVAIILASLIRVHPVFMPLYILALLGVTVLAGVASNIYIKAAQSDALSTAANSMGIMTFILSKLPILIFIIGIVVMIVLYKTAPYVE